MGLPLDDTQYDQYYEGGPYAADLAATPSKRRWLDRLKSAGPGIINGAINAAATPNIAGGGGTDIFRALAHSRGMQQQQDLTTYGIGRQRQLDYLKQRDDERKWAQEGLNARKIDAEIQNHQAQMGLANENAASLRAQREAATEDHQSQIKSRETQRQVDIGKAGGEVLPEADAVNTQIGGVNVPMIPRMTGPAPKDSYVFKDPFSGKSVAIRHRNDQIEIDPEMGADLGLVPGPDGKIMLDKGAVARLVGNKSKPGRPENAGHTQVEPTLGKKMGIIPNETGEFWAPDTSLARAVGNETKIVLPPRERQEPASITEKKALQAAKTAALTASGNDYGKLAAALQAGQFNQHPDIGPYVSEIQDWATKQAHAASKATETKGAAAAMATRADAAMTAGGRIKKMIAEAQAKHPMYFGPVAGRIIGGNVQSAGQLPEDLSKLASEVHSLFAMQPAQHGYRAKAAMDAIAAAGGAEGLFKNPSGLIGGINAIMEINKDFRNGIQTGRMPAGIELPPELRNTQMEAPGGTQPAVFRYKGADPKYANKRISIGADQAGSVDQSKWERVQ